jgi:hypothetical protein
LPRRSQLHGLSLVNYFREIGIQYYKQTDAGERKDISVLMKQIIDLILENDYKRIIQAFYRSGQLLRE